MPKRVMDISVALFLLVLFSPILFVAAFLILLDSPGPVFFTQPRMGRGFRLFRLFKLRTMRIHCEGLAYTLGRDPRITTVGRCLRWTKFDELPQLWNVVRGDMSLVGPRPVVPELALEFRESYEVLLTVRPGLTDPATMKYCREVELLALVPDPLSYFKTVLTPQKLRISAAYIERATVLTDLGVMAGTALALFPLKRRLFNDSRWNDENAKLVCPERTSPEKSPVPLDHP